MKSSFGGALLLSAALPVLSGCGILPKSGAEAFQEQPCAPSKDGKPKKASELIEMGNLLRDSALTVESMRPGSADEQLEQASFCYATALSSAPDNYEANLGLGVTYIARARKYDEREDEPRRKALLKAAKRSLGRAFMVRQGPYEPLYYLAEVAVLENDHSRAAGFLQEMRANRAKLGPVTALAGYIAHEAGNEHEAENLWRQSLETGWPQETMHYVAGGNKTRNLGMIIGGSVTAGVGLFPLIGAGVLFSEDAAGAGIGLMVLGMTMIGVGIPIAIGGAGRPGPDVAENEFDPVPTVVAGPAGANLKWEF
jgi:hypothetical protein